MTETTRIAAALSDRYVIEREIGAGGMATVYLARDKKHDRDVALKILRADLSAVLGGDRFLNEVRITARLDHPHILTLIDSGEADGIYYYVLPYVRGESLRSKLEREKQLGLDEALSITRQIASALDYAHKQGVVHRDIKPENILLHEGEAMLADFGIALAVKEAGGNRLTETGLSLGTPQYMSPEQATGDRTLDARSDVYSLAAVCYEMLAGEAPVTGATAQAMIAKLMTERPTRLRVVRDTVPEGIDDAVAKALAKVPADRFTSAGAFSQALAVASKPARASGAARRPAGAVWFAMAVAVITALVLVLPKLKGGGAAPAGMVLRNRTQLTTTGRVTNPAISPDGKQLAYVVQNCGAQGCRYAIEMKDIGGTTTRTLFDGATSMYDLAWSPDRRHLLFLGSVGNRYGNWLISALGGAPRHVTIGTVVFFADGDSLLMTDISARPDTLHWVKVAGLDGAVADSIPVRGLANGVGVSGYAGGDWIVVIRYESPNNDILLIRRDGSVGGSVSLGSHMPVARVAVDALFMHLFRAGSSNPPIVRVAIDTLAGRLSSRVDTLYTGEVTRFDVTRDGDALVLDEGAAEYSSWVVDTRELLRGELSEARRLLRSTSTTSILISPDGSRALVRRVSDQRFGTQLSVMPSAGGTETVIPLVGPRLLSFWHDSASVAVAEKVEGGVQLSLASVRGGPRRNVLVVRDSAVLDMASIGGGWAWIPSNQRRLMVRLPGDSAERAISLPPWFVSAVATAPAVDGQHVAVSGWDAATTDSVGVYVIDIRDGTAVRWWAAFGEDAVLQGQPDGSLLFSVYTEQEILELGRLRGPGRREVIGRVPRPVFRVTLSADARRAAVTVRDRHGDAWMSRVVRP